jgi:hypothetical protein
MNPLGQPVGKRFVRTDYAGYIVGFDHRREGGSYLVRYEDGGLLHFPARELDTYRNYYVHMQNCEQRRKSSLTCFLLRERKCIVSLPAVAVGLKGGGEARGGLPFCNTHATMVKSESGGSVF